MTWLARQWNSFWFTPTRPTNLALSRLFFFGLVLWYYRRFFGADSFRSWTELPRVFWMPEGFFEMFGIGVLSGPGLEILTLVWVVSLAASCLGLLTRPAVFLAFCCSLYLLGLPHNFGKVDHSDAILILMMGAFAVSRCGDAFSADALLRRFFATSAERPEASPEYTWPLRLCWVAFTLMFFAAGVAKLRTSGLQWILSDNMAILLTRHQLTHDPLLDLGPALADITWVPTIIAAATVVLEVGAPLALFSRTLRRVIIPGLLSTQIGIWVLLGVSFRQMFPAYVVWIPYRELARVVSRHAERAAWVGSGATPASRAGGEGRGDTGGGC